MVNFSEVLFRQREVLDPKQRNPKCETVRLEWTSTRGETSCEAPSSDPQSHTRPFVCTIDDCRSTYRRRDHLNHRLLQHQGKLLSVQLRTVRVNLLFKVT
ncbi:PREDICTED: uncharacterized protein LOC101300004 [Fragaria vesca subsp. vesca]